MNKEEKPSKETLNEWKNDSSNWKCGIFYYNKDDKRILPPKRVSWMGWTVNFANPTSVIVFIIFLIIAVGLVLFLPN